MFFDILLFMESRFSQNFSNTVISPFGGLYVTLNISIQSDSTSFEFMDRSLRGLKYSPVPNNSPPPPLTY